jgi:ubiquinone biosynthesis protein
MDILRIAGVCLTEYPYYLLSSKYDYSRFWKKCIDINILYTKLLQSFAINYINDDKFYYHFNDIPYSQDEIPTIEHITSTKVIGSGMISVVMEGVTKENESCIIKVKRNNIDEKITQGLKQIFAIIQWLNYIPFIRKFNLLFIFEQFATVIKEQLNFNTEIQNHKKFKKNVSYNSNIVVPDLYEEYCTPSQIVMTKLEGIHYTPTIKNKNDMYIKLLNELVAKNFVLDGFIHSDLHPGNILFLEDKIGILDFGLMITLTVTDKQNIIDLLYNVVHNNYIEAVDIFYDHFIEPASVKQKLSKHEIYELKFNICYIYSNAYEINKIFNYKDIYQIIKVTNKYGLYISKTWYKLMLFFISSDNLVKQLTDSCFPLFMDSILPLLDNLKKIDENEI